MKKIIGILGGIGAEASAEFYKHLIQKIQEKNIVKQNTDYPHIIINSIPAEELYIANPNLQPYLEGLKELESAGASFIVMICNTAHVFYEQFQKEINIPLLDLRKEVTAFLNKKDINSITLLATKTTVDANLFQPKQKQNILENAEFIFLHELITDYQKRKNRENIEKFRLIATKYAKKSDMLISACTELSLMLQPLNIPFIDTMDILVEATIKAWKP